MTFRTILLAGCMVMVPAAALFSHRLPAGLRAALRETAVAGMTRCREAVTGRVVSSAAVAVAAGPVDRPSTDQPLHHDGREPAADPPAPAVSAADRLAGLGVIGFDCHPVAGTSGEHQATCQVPLDATGQLVRVFHATGRDGDAALAALATEVEGWRHRAAAPARSGAVPAASTRH